MSLTDRLAERLYTLALGDVDISQFNLEEDEIQMTKNDWLVMAEECQRQMAWAAMEHPMMTKRYRPRERGELTIAPDDWSPK